MKMLSERGGRQEGVGVMLARGVIRDNWACWGDMTALPGAPRVQVARPRSQQGQLPGPRVWVGQAGELILTHLDTQWFVDLFPHPARSCRRCCLSPLLHGFVTTGHLRTAAAAGEASWWDDGGFSSRNPGLVPRTHRVVYNHPRLQLC